MLVTFEYWYSFGKGDYGESYIEMEITEEDAEESDDAETEETIVEETPEFVDEEVAEDDQQSKPKRKGLAVFAIVLSIVLFISLAVALAYQFLYIQTKLLLLQILRLPTKSTQTKQPSPASELMYQRTIDKAMQIASERIYEKLSVSDLAALVNVSTSQLTLLFRNYLNTTPGKYITRVRLEESKVLLAEQGKSVGAVAAQLGYASIQHFSKQFHDWYDCSPSFFVRQNRVR